MLAGVTPMIGCRTVPDWLPRGKAHKEQFICVHLPFQYRYILYKAFQTP
jgi:hypothetical protein